MNKLFRFLSKPLKRTQIFWNFAAQVARHLPDGAFKKDPDEIVVDVTNVCNLRCPVCFTHIDMQRSRGLMSMATFSTVIDSFASSAKKPQISLNFSGEPTLNPALPDFIRYASSHGHRTMLSTNCTKLTEELARALMEAGLTTVLLCMDGNTAEAHEAYRIGSSFETVRSNIETFLAIKKELGSPVHTVLQTLLTSHSENQQEDIISWAENVGLDEVVFKTLNMGTYTSASQREQLSYLLPEHESNRRISGEICKTVCTLPLRQSVVFWNGDVGLCCIDVNGSVKMPNINEAGLRAAFTSKASINARKLAVTRKHPVCERCGLASATNPGRVIKLTGGK